MSTLATRNIIMYTVVSAVLIVAAFGIYNVDFDGRAGEAARHRDPEIDRLSAPATSAASS